MAKPDPQDGTPPAGTAAPQPDLAALLAGMTPEQLAGLTWLAAQNAPPVPGRHRDTGEIAPLGQPETTPLTVGLQARHLDWLTKRAQAYGEPPEQHLVRIMLEFRTSDSWSVVPTTPTGLGDMAGSALRLG